MVFNPFILCEVKMAKKSRKTTYLTANELEELNKLSDQDVLKAFMRSNKALNAKKREKRQDAELKRVREEIKKHREENISEEKKKKLEQLKSAIKEIKDEVDEEISELFDTLKALNQDYREDMGPIKEKIKMLERIIEQRKIN